MIGLILVTRGVHSGKDVIFGYPNSIFRQNLSYFDSVHFNTTITGSNTSKNFILGWPVSVIAELLCPKKERWDTILDFSAESIRFIGYPASIGSKSKAKPLRIMSSLSVLSNDSDLSSRLKENIAAFSVVLVFQVDDPLLNHSENIKEAVIAINQTLKFEEMRSGYLSSEIRKLKNIRETAQSKEEEIQEMIQESMLAKELSGIYSDLLIKRESFMEINGWLKLNLLIAPNDCEFDCFEYHSLLFFDNPKRIENFIYEKNQNSLLFILMKKCKYPTESFKKIAEDEGVTFKAVKNAALHFVRWNKAKLISCVNDDSLFVNDSKFLYDRDLVDEYERIFKQKEAEFLRILAWFSAPRSVKSLESLQIPRPRAIPLVTWLLRKQVIESIYCYLYVLHNPDLASLDDQSQEFQTLVKIFEFCNRQIMIEEIVSKSGVSLEDIKKCVKHFRKYLKMVIH